jgi:GT2 family glycosyltransferase
VSQPARQPLVSVIVPVRDDAARLRQCLAALADQSYPSERCQVIVVDNASSDHPERVVTEFPKVSLVHQPDRGSYAARNRGLETAHGAVVAFTDADCVPARGWLSAGTARLAESESTALVAGRIEVFARDRRRPIAVERYETLFAFPQRTWVEQVGFGATANLFAEREVFHTVGGFDPERVSGGDLEWCRRAGQAGYLLVYADEACVAHPARHSWRQLAARAQRVTRGAESVARTDAALFDQGPTRRIAKHLVPPMRTLSRLLADERVPTRRDALATCVAMTAERWIAAWQMLRAARARETHEGTGG